MPDSSGIETEIVLGEGLLEVDYPVDLLNPSSYRWAGPVSLNPSESYDQLRNVALPDKVEKTEGTLVAVVTEPPRMLSFVDKLARQEIPSPPQGSELVLGSGTVRLVRHRAGGRPTPGERTAISVGDALVEDRVRSLFGIKVRLLLRPVSPD